MRLSKYVCFYRFNNSLYLFNTLNKSILQIDKSTENKLKNNIHNLSTSEKNYLEHLEYIVDDNYNEYDSALSNLEIINKAHKRLELTILMTNNCNCDCYYCYEKKMFSNFSTFDMLTELEKFLSDASSFYDEEIHLSFHGGEPTLYPDNIISVYNIVSKYYKKTYTSIVTNGTLCGDEKVLRTLKIINPDIVLITIDGPKEVHDKRRSLKNGNSSFDRIMYGIKKLKGIKVIPEISINLDKNNMIDLHEWYKLIKDLDISSFNISRVVSGEKHIVDSCLSLKEFRGIVNEFYNINDVPSKKNTIQSIIDEFFTPMVCSAKSTNSIVVDPEGYIYNCISMTGDRNYAVGDISQNYTDIVPYLSECNTLIDEQCMKCKYLPLCYGGSLLEKLTDKIDKGCLFNDFESKLPRAIKNYVFLQNEKI